MTKSNEAMRRGAMRRRRLVGAALAAPWVAGCSSLPVTLRPESTPAASAKLRECAQAHGAQAFGKLHDINVSYSGQWRALIGRLQPALVDGAFRVSSQERLLPEQGLIAQAHSGPGGSKQVLRHAAAPGSSARGEVRVWFNGEEAPDEEHRAAAALVADGYTLFLLGPLATAGRVGGAELGGTASVDGHACDIVNLQLVPGLGFAPRERVALLIDRQDLIVRSIRFSLDGLASTQGAVAEVELYDHVTRHGVVWPTRFYERLLRPIPRMPVHDWQLTGLDVNRGYAASAISGPGLSGAAVAPATLLAAA